jgi:hypothetical protein
MDEAERPHFGPGTRMASGPFGPASDTCNVTTHWRKETLSRQSGRSTFYSLAILRCRLFNAPFIRTNPIRHTCVRLTNSADARLSATIAGPSINRGIAINTNMAINIQGKRHDSVTTMRTFSRRAQQKRSFLQFSEIVMSRASFQ